MAASSAWVCRAGVPGRRRRAPWPWVFGILGFVMLPVIGGVLRSGAAVRFVDKEPGHLSRFGVLAGGDRASEAPRTHERETHGGSAASDSEDAAAWRTLGMMRSLLATLLLVLMAAACARPGGQEVGLATDDLGIPSLPDLVPTAPDAERTASPERAPTADIDVAPTGASVDAIAFEACADLEPPEPAVDGPLRDDPEVAEAQVARAAVALPSDEQTVAALVAAGPGAEGWPLEFPATPEEFDALMARNGNADPAVQEWAQAEHADTFAGVWLDQSGGGILTLGFTREAEQRAADIEDRFGLEVAAVTMQFTYAELSTAQDRLFALLTGDANPSPPGQIQGLSVSVTVNRLEVMMLGDSATTRARIAELVDPAMVCLQVQDIPTVADAEPAPWQPVPGADVSASSTAIDVLVREWACTGDLTAEGRVVVDALRYEAGAVVVTLAIVPLGGAHDCLGHPDTEFTIALDEPLGDRPLIDGRTGAPPTIEPTPPN